MRASPRRLQLCMTLTASYLGATGCAAGSSTGAAGDSGDAGAGDAAFELGVDATLDGDLGRDTADVTSEVDAALDTDVAEVDTDPLGPLGAPCASGADCASGVCVDVVGGDGDGVCALPCVDDASCPRDFDCVLIEASGDGQRVCLDVALCIDPDGDLHGVGPGCVAPDCDETDPRRNLSTDEVCDGRDNDCDGEVDDDPRDEGLRCDTGFAGVCGPGTTLCTDGLIGCAGDDPLSSELCDARDNDCDGLVDEADGGGPLTRPCYDGDLARVGVGPCALGAQTCSEGGFSACLGQVLPAAELCDTLDNDCDGTPDDGLSRSSYYVDADRDGFGDGASAAILACARPDGTVENASDCDDRDSAIRPGVGERPGDGVDQNCDTSEFCFEDVDGDAFRPTSSAAIVSLDTDCSDPGEALGTQPSGDCDDGRAGVHPGAPELCDGLDNDCDVRVDEGSGCLAVGAPCVDAIDCATGLCEGGFCVRPITCVEAGSCPDRVAQTAGGARRSSARFVLEVTAPAGSVTPVLESGSYRLVVGPNPYITDP